MKCNYNFLVKFNNKTSNVDIFCFFFIRTNILFESGLFGKMWTIGMLTLIPTSWEQKHQNMLTNSDVVSASVTFEDTLSLIVVYNLFLLLAFLILLLEIIWRYKSHFAFKLQSTGNNLEYF